MMSNVVDVIISMGGTAQAIRAWTKGSASRKSKKDTHPPVVFKIALPVNKSLKEFRSRVDSALNSLKNRGKVSISYTVVQKDKFFSIRVQYLGLEEAPTNEEIRIHLTMILNEWVNEKK